MKRAIALVFLLPLLFSCTGFGNVQESVETFELPHFNEGDSRKPLAGCDTYRIGTGAADITEYPCGQINGGYVEGKQKTAGIHTRQKVKAFIIEDANGKRVVFLVIDDWAVTLEMKETLAQKLTTGIFTDKFGKEIDLKDDKGNPFYNVHNVMMTASHTHNGVMGDAQRRQYNIPAGGFNEELMQITVDGSMRAILMAHQNMQDGTVEFAKGDLTGRYNVSKNRSMEAFLNNESDKGIDLTTADFEAMDEIQKEELRNHPNATDKDMYLLRLRSYPEGKDLGMINWFSIHSTSISASNTMISGDNKGVAQQIVEEAMGTRADAPADFVAGFATSALGDVGSSRIIYNIDKFGYKLEEEIENVVFSARAQAAKALELYSKPQLAVSGDVGYAFQYTSMDRVEVGEEYAYMPEKYAPRTLPPASGWSMAAGSEIHRTSIPGGKEGKTTENGSKMPLIGFARAWTFWTMKADTKNDIGRLVFPPKSFREMHEPKPVLMASGNTLPTWMDTDLPIQIFKIGNVAVISTPFETTTVSSRRLRQKVMDEFARQGSPVDEVIYAGNSNAYVSYMATPEEFLMQHYEGASTNFGINQHPACEQELVRLTGKLLKGETGRIPGDPEWVAATPVRVPEKDLIRARVKRPLDRVPAGKKFGQQVEALTKGLWKTGEILEVEFYSSNMNRDIYHDSSFFEIQRYSAQAENWLTISTDDDFTTNLRWNRKSANYATSTVIWRIPAGTPAGEYRILFKGSFAPRRGEQTRFSALSETFSISDERNSVTSDFTASTDGMKAQIKPETPVGADIVVVRLQESIGSAVTTAEIVINNELTYPLRNITADGNATRLYFPDIDVSEVELKVLTKSSSDYTPVIEEFALYNSSITNEVKHFELECK